VVFRETRTDSSINLVPLWSYFGYAENRSFKEMAIINILNVVMFLPVGCLLRLGFLEIGWKQALVVGLILSALIELSQFFFKKGLCEIDDVIHNVIGCMIGYGLLLKIKCKF
jgi:glycopeptide antibiotics resistance protein